MNVLGVDPSLTGTGVARPDGTVAVVRPGKLRGVRRLAYLRDALALELVGATVAVIEGYSYGSKGRALFDIGEWGGVLRLLAFEMNVPYAIVPPSTVKKFATGNGNAPKELMLTEAVKRLAYQGHNLDEVDALWLRHAGEHHYGVGTLRIPASNGHALTSVPWPTLARRRP